VMREVTERPEGVDEGLVQLVGTNISKIIEMTTNILLNKIQKTTTNKIVNPYGDGHASEYIVNIILNSLHNA